MPTTQLTASNAATIAAICSKLEGIPLAIELAAGQTATIAPSQMLRHLDRRLTALSTRRRDATARHRSLRAAIDYSFESLPPKLQRLFAALSTFKGGDFTVESALPRCAFAGWKKGDRDRNPGAVAFCRNELCLEAIVDLQERSLVRSDGPGGTRQEPRFRDARILPRQYGEEHLPLRTRDSSLKCLRHVQYLLRLHFGTFLNTLRLKSTPTSTLRIAAEHDNFVACIEFLFQAKDFETCVRLLGVMSKAWLHQGPRVIEREYIRQISILTRDKPIDPLVQIRLLRMVGTTYIRASDYAAAHRSMELAVEVGAGLGRSRAGCGLLMWVCPLAPASWGT